jgi:hypothetical protein
VRVLNFAQELMIVVEERGKSGVEREQTTDSTEQRAES